MTRLGAVALIAFATQSATAQTKLLRFPDVHGERVVFTYAGDLWTAPVAGGTATRLTAHPGLELFAKFSPDGKWIAFTGQYDGDEQVYVVPSSGGTPKQLTHYPAGNPRAERWGYDNQVYGWTRDGSRILFKGNRETWSLGQTRLYTVSPNGGSSVPLPMPLAGAGAYSPDGRRIVYSKVFRDFRPEKRYSGGQANYLWVFDLRNNSAQKISKGPRAERDPMWIGNKIYFNSDRDGTFNLYAYDVASGQSTQVTRSNTWDVRWPSSDDEQRIVYESNGELQVLDVRNGQSTPIRINVPEDGVHSRPARVAANTFIENWSLSPQGQRALFAARGDVFTLPIERGPTRNITETPGAHEKWPAWSPDGSKIAYISDASGEEEIYVEPQDGSTPAERVTSGGKAMRYRPLWAPDNKRIAYSDKDGKLSVVTLADKRVVEIANEPRGTITDYAWSPRGNYLAFSMTRNEVTDPNRSIYIWSASDGQLRRATNTGFNEYNPAWDPEGNYLFYRSDRDYAPMLSNTEFNIATTRTTGIFALALRRDAKNPFPMESDEVTIDTASTSGPPATPRADTAARPSTPAPAANAELRIDFEGLGTRVARVPIDGDNIGGIAAKRGFLLYTVSGNPYYGRESDKRTALKIYSLRDRRETVLLDDITGWSLSSDGSKVLVRQGAQFALYDATPAGATTRKAVATNTMFTTRVPKEEWAQIFNEVWRRYRDFFYVTNMHGYDWEALRRQYEPWLAHVAHRSDLNYLISEMISELTVQHAYVAGGDWQNPQRIPVALPGALFSLDSAAGRFRISKIYPGHNEETIYRSPLTEIGTNAKVGDYVLAIDGEDLRANDDPYRLLRGKVDRPVTLTLASSPTGPTRQVSYRPISSEGDLVYLEMVLANMKRVNEMTNGRVGYIHVPNMGAEGLREFIKWFYPQIRKEALIVDDRANGGGNVSQILIERLRRTLLGVNFGRLSDFANTYPATVFTGPMVMLADEYSASDGDIFPYMFKEAKIGPVIGKRTWGGVVGINNTGDLIDGTLINVPTSGLANTKGEWVIEGYGVDPDIEVEQDPTAVIAGRDPQLERAVQEVMKMLQTKGQKLPNRPDSPNKTRGRPIP